MHKKKWILEKYRSGTMAISLSPPRFGPKIFKKPNPVPEINTRFLKTRFCLFYFYFEGPVRYNNRISRPLQVYSIYKYRSINLQVHIFYLYLYTFWQILIIAYFKYFKIIILKWCTSLEVCSITCYNWHVRAINAISAPRILPPPI